MGPSDGIRVTRGVTAWRPIETLRAKVGQSVAASPRPLAPENDPRPAPADIHRHAGRSAGNAHGRAVLMHSRRSDSAASHKREMGMPLWAQPPGRLRPPPKESLAMAEVCQ